MNGPSPQTWDLAVVGAGPAGSAVALGALFADPSVRVLLIDRAEFPRDKACGDGIAPHAVDVLAHVGVHGLLDDRVPVQRLRLRSNGATVLRSMDRPGWVVPRRLFDFRLVRAAVSRGATLRRHRVRSVEVRRDGVVVDRHIRAKVAVGADGAYSVVRGAAGAPAVRGRALAIRGYAPTPRERVGMQEIVFGPGQQPSYAWSFDRGDGLSNVGYGELLTGGRRTPSRAALLRELETLLPGATVAGDDWLGHHLPLSSWRWHQPDGRVLLAGDAAGLINPLTGEGIYYAVATGVLAGQAAVAALAAGDPDSAGARHREAVRALLARHLRHTSVAARLAGLPGVSAAGVRAAAADQDVFDQLVEVGLGRGLLSARVVGDMMLGGNDRVSRLLRRSIRGRAR